jgi:hypothetical protein
LLLYHSPFFSIDNQIELQFAIQATMRALQCIYIYIQWFFWKFSSRSSFFSLSLSLDSTGTYYRGYIILYFYSFIHFIPIFFPSSSFSSSSFSKLIDRHPIYIYLQVMNKILTFSEIWILLFHSWLELVRPFLFLFFPCLLFDTIIIHCLKKKQRIFDMDSTCYILFLDSNKKRQNFNFLHK